MFLLKLRDMRDKSVINKLKNAVSQNINCGLNNVS